jgi:CRP/FNR family transcriptional regulator, cyclic AMP receptor protein
MDRASHSGEMIDKLRHIELFRGLSGDEAALSQVARLCTTLACGAGTLVFAEGDVGDTMYIIKSGVVEIVKKTSQGDSYTVAELSSDKNMFFGEMAILDEEKRSAGVLCRTDCEFWVLSRRNFLALGDASPVIGLSITREVAKIVVRRLRKANGDIITLFDALVGEVAESGGLGA